jgi:hypothetical protein
MAPRNALLEELHLLATDHCRQSGSGTSAGAIRFGQLMLLLWDGAVNLLKFLKFLWQQLIKSNLFKCSLIFSAIFKILRKFFFLFPGKNREAL